MAYTWLKKKYTVGKLTGHTSKHNDGTRRKLKRKLSDAQKVAVHAKQPRVVLHVSQTGKRRFVRG